MTTKPKNEILKECINRICHHVKVKYYGYNSLYPTGPGLLGEVYFEKHNLKNIELYHTRNGKYIINKEKPIIGHYKEYRKEQKKSEKPKYFELWRKRKIYL